MPKISIQLPNTKIQKDQYCTNVLIQLSNFIPQGELRPESKKSILSQYELYLFNKLIHFDPIYNFTYQLSSEISSRTGHLHRLFTS